MLVCGSDKPARRSIGRICYHEPFAFRFREIIFCLARGRVQFVAYPFYRSGQLFAGVSQVESMQRVFGATTPNREVEGSKSAR